MSIDKHTQLNNYFEYRNIKKQMYSKTTLPIWIKNNIPEKNLKILDYGCGLGQILVALQNEGYLNSYGVDIEKKSIEYCINSNLNVKELDIDNLKNPFDTKFEIIIISHVIEHIQKDMIISTLKLIKDQFLSIDGKLLLAVPNAQSNTDSYWAYEDWTHTTLFTSGSLYYVLKAAGFTEVEFIDIDCELGLPKYKVLIKKMLLKLYIANKIFWNKVTSSSYHEPSPRIFSYEIKVKAY